MSNDDWPAPPSPGTIHIWICEGIEHEAFDRCQECLNAADRERAGRFMFDADRRRFIGSRLLMHYILAHYLNRAPEELSFVFNQWGKPALHERLGSELQFNLSQSSQLALLGISRDGPLGIDVERRNDERACAAIAQRQFSDPEREHLAQAADPSGAFFEIWARKEAYIKGLGRGLAHPLGMFDVSPRTGEGLVHDWSDHRTDSRWVVESLDLAIDGYAAALATKSPAPDRAMISISGEELIARVKPRPASEPEPGL